MARFPRSSLRSGRDSIVSRWSTCRCCKLACLRIRSSSSMSAVDASAPASRISCTMSGSHPHSVQRHASRSNAWMRMLCHAESYPRSVLVPRLLSARCCFRRRHSRQYPLASAILGQRSPRHGLVGRRGIYCFATSGAGSFEWHARLYCCPVTQDQHDILAAAFLNQSLDHMELTAQQYGWLKMLGASNLSDLFLVENFRLIPNEKARSIPKRSLMLKRLSREIGYNLNRFLWDRVMRID